MTGLVENQPPGIIKVAGLRKRYGKIEALKGISFGVGHGEVFALLGPNGSGKTTALEIIMGLRRPDAGAIEYFDAKGQASSKPRIGAVFQGRVYYDSLSVRELIAYYGSFYRRPHSGVERYLRMVNLQDKLDSRFSDLSDGQKQQLAIVLSLVNDPELLFFDEPCNALDPQIRHRIWELIRTLKKEGKTLVFTTHYIEEAEELADRVSILSKGEIVVTDSPANIIRNYNETYVVELKFDSSVESGTLNGYGFGDVSFRDGVYSFNVDAIDSSLMKVLEAISGKHKLSRISIGKSSLESIFVRVTEERFAQ